MVSTIKAKKAKRSKKIVAKGARTAEIFGRRHDVVNVSDQVITVSDFPIDEQTKFVAFLQTNQVSPGSSITWYTNGPPGATVTFSLIRVANSGGHNHGGGPTGAIVPPSITLGPTYPQNVQTTYTAPDAAGSIEQHWQASNGQSGLDMVQVGITGLVELTGGVGLTLTGSKPIHPRNHFGTPTLNSKIQQLAAAFHSKFNKNIFVNDASLEQGGLFDHQGTWAPPHSTHREGRTVDMNSTSMTTAERDFFRQTAVSLGFAVTLETTPPHWHLFI